MEYETLRQFADSWGLLFLFIVFIIVVAFVFRRGARSTYDEYAKIPLKDD